MLDLSGRVALVTGAGQSVGAGIARGLAAQGAASQIAMNGRATIHATGSNQVTRSATEIPHAAEGHMKRQ